MLNKLADSELVLNEDGSVYHLNLFPEDIAEKIILNKFTDLFHEKIEIL